MASEPKLWFDKWEWAAWKSDAAVRRCSANARTLWFECLGDMFIQGTTSIGGTADEFARAVGCLTPSEVDAALSELERLNVCGVTRNNGVVTLTSRRREKAHKARQSNAERQQRHRETRRRNAGITPERIEDRGKNSETTTATTKPRKRGVSGVDADLPDDLRPYDAAIRQFLDYRVNLKKPVYDLSLEAMFKKMREFGPDLPAVIEQSIANGWQGLFALKAGFSRTVKPDVSQEFSRG